MEFRVNMITIAFTRAQRLQVPDKLPDVTRSEAASWFSGWWHGIGVGAVLGFSLGALVVRWWL